MSPRTAVLGLALIVAPLLRAEDARAAVHFIDGPAAVTLGAEASLDLPSGWRFVPRADLPAYFAGGARRAGAWDRGLVLPGEGGAELRLVFEPLGAVDDAAAPDPAALLARGQALALARAQRLGLSESLQRSLVDWRWEPTYDAARKVLRFGGFWREAGEESVGLHLRWLGRAGVLKLDWQGSQAEADEFSAWSEVLDEGLRFNDGQRLEERQPGDRASSLDLDQLVLDGLFGRGALVAGPGPEASTPWTRLLSSATGRVALALAALAALVAFAVAVARRAAAWLERRARTRQDARRLDYIEKKYGSADDVEEIEEEGQAGYGEEGKP